MVGLSLQLEEALEGVLRDAIRQTKQEIVQDVCHDPVVRLTINALTRFLVQQAQQYQTQDFLLLRHRDGPERAGAMEMVPRDGLIQAVIYYGPGEEGTAEELACFRRHCILHQAIMQASLMLSSGP